MLYSRATIPAISMRFQLGASVSTALSLGTTAPMAALAQRGVPGRGPWGVGYGAACIIRGSGERKYHSRATPQALLEVV